MYKKIIVAMGLDHGHGATSMSLARHLKDDDGEIIAVHVLEPVPGFARYYLPPEHEAGVEQHAVSAIAERVGPANDAKVVILRGYPGPTLTEYAETIGADCIIIGSHKPDMQDYLLGSTAARVVRHATCAVHVLR